MVSSLPPMYRAVNVGILCYRLDAVAGVCGVASELTLVQCFAIRFLTNPKTIMQS